MGPSEDILRRPFSFRRMGVTAAILPTGPHWPPVAYPFQSEPAIRRKSGCASGTEGLPPLLKVGAKGPVKRIDAMENDRNIDEQQNDTSTTSQSQQAQPTGQQADYGQPTSEADPAVQPTDQAQAQQPTDQAGFAEGDTLTEQRSETEIEGSAQQAQPTGEESSGFVGSASDSDSSDQLVERDEQ